MERVKEKKLKILPIFLPFASCPFKCIYCNQNSITNSSKIPTLLEIEELVKKFISRNQYHKKEVAFFGGTFTAIPLKEQKKYLDSAGNFLKKDDGIRISTRPDCISDKNLEFLLKNNVKTIELGIQSFSERVLLKSKRGYSKQQSLLACQKIKNSGMNLGIQLMPFLPGFNKKSLEETIFETIRIAPEYIRIYPTLVLKNTSLENLYRDGEYLPASLEKSTEVTIQMCEAFMKKDLKIIKIGLHSDIILNKNDIVAGGYHPAFGEMVLGEILKKKIISKSFKGAKKLLISPKDTSLFMGNGQMMLKKLKCEIGDFKMEVSQDLLKGKFKIIAL